MMEGDYNMLFLEDKDIRAYKIKTENKDEPAKALPGFYYWNCPRCKKILGSGPEGFDKKCMHCGQVVFYGDFSYKDFFPEKVGD